MTSTPIIRVSNLSKSYSGKLVIDDINLEIISGEIFALVGLNGQGKTSLIKSILDLCSIDDGVIELFGKYSSDPKSRSQISYLPEKFQPSKDLKAIEFLKFNYKISNGSGDIDYQEIYSLCDDLHLKRDDLNKKVTSFSKGMVQKLGIVATFSAASRLLILDEPMSGLDPQARSNLKKVIKKYVKDGKKSILFTSHILSDVEYLCDRVAILHNQKIRYNGKINQLMPAEEASFEDKFLQVINS